MYTLSRLHAMLLLILFVCCKEPDDGAIHVSTASTHPRILLLEGEEQQIRDLIDSDESWQKMHFAILETCNEILGKPALERKMIGRRLLSTSRECLRRVFYLSYGYRMTGDDRFFQKAREEMLAVSAFTDWNPSHFLDVAEMTMGLAIGYDWLYATLTESDRNKIRDAIVAKGLNPSFDEDYNWFLRATHNWNQVCNAGMTYGALAVQEDHPELAQRVIDRAFQSIPLAMEDYQPDGAYPEGYSYWGYGTSFNVMFISAVEKALGTDQGLAKQPGFLETAGFLAHMLAPSGDSYNWGDCGPGGNLQPAMFWFAAKQEEPSLLWMENHFLQTSDYDRFTGNRLLPAMMIWGKGIPLQHIQPPAARLWVGQGKNPVCLMRSSWTDPNAVYLGFKAGSPSVNHGHMDIGSFIMEADGERWVADLGSQNYESLESKGMQIFGKTQDAQRWTVFRMNNFSHATLTINDQHQQVSGYAQIDRYADHPEFSFALSDISSVYTGQLKQAQRGVAMVEGSYVVIRDEVQTLDQPTRLRWQILTPAAVSLSEKGAELRQQGKTLMLKVSGPDNLVMRTWSTAPTNDYDAPNPGTILVGFECDLPAQSSVEFEILLVPESHGTDPGFLAQPLADWQ